MNRLLLLLATALPLSFGIAAHADTTKPTYTYPPQASRSEIFKTDSGCTLLTDGRRGQDGPQSVWGKWNEKEMIVDWTFPEPVSISRIKVAIVHTQPESTNAHVAKIKFFGSDGNSAFQDDPDQVRDIAFEAGKVQEAELLFEPNELTVKKLRTVFQGASHQVVISEVQFETTATSSEALQQAQEKRQKAQSEPLQKTTLLPAPLPDSAKVTADTIFGMCGHLLHTDFFMSQFSPYWDISYTLPLLVNANITWVREPLYQNLFCGEAGELAKNQKTIAANRAKVENALAQYNARNIKVILCPSLHPKSTGFDDYSRWLASLTLRFPCVKALEMHNEPNLKGFWKGTIADYVQAVKTFAAIVKGVNPSATIIVGSFSGWGGAWQHEELRELISGPKDLATRWAEEAFKLGLLEYADATSAHPYRGKSAPEGGDVLQERTDPEGFAKEIQGWQQLVKKYAPANKPTLPLYITEIGYSVSSTGYTNVETEQRQAEYLSRLMLILFEQRLKGMPIESVCWYDLKQDETTNDYEHNFGIVTTDTSRLRPAYLAFQKLARFFDRTDGFSLEKFAVTSVNGSNHTKIIPLRRKKDGALILVYWRLNQLQKRDADFSSTLSFALPEKFQPTQVTLHAPGENQPRATGFTVTKNILSIPVQVSAEPSWLVVKN